MATSTTASKSAANAAKVPKSVNFSRPRYQHQPHVQSTAASEKNYQDWVDGIHTRMAFIETMIRDLQAEIPPPVPVRAHGHSMPGTGRVRSLRKTKPVASLRDLRAQHSDESLRSAYSWSPESPSDLSSNDSRSSYASSRDSWSTTLWPLLEESDNDGLNKEADELSRWIIESLLGYAGPTVET